MTPLARYLLAFALSIYGGHPSAHRIREMRAIVDEIDRTDASAEEALVLVNIAFRESRFERGAIGKKGEKGAWQVMPPSRNGFGAREALRRLREQGMQGYCGCPRPCPLTVAERTEPAKLYRLAFDPPGERAASDSFEAMRDFAP